MLSRYTHRHTGVGADVLELHPYDYEYLKKHGQVIMENDGMWFSSYPPSVWMFFQYGEFILVPDNWYPTEISEADLHALYEEVS